MSHTFKGGSCIIHHNLDYSGDATVQVINGQSIVIDCADLLEFAANFMRLRRIGYIETATWQELLK